MAYVISDKCEKCGLCVSTCPLECISEGDPFVVDADACVSCGACESACAFGAISEE